MCIIRFVLIQYVIIKQLVCTKHFIIAIQTPICFGYISAIIRHNTYLLAYLLTSLITYLRTPWNRVVLEKLTGSQLVKKFPKFYGSQRFVTAFTTARHLSLSWASSMQSTPPYPTSWRSVLIISSHLPLCLPSGLFPSGFPIKTLYTPLFSP